MKVLQGNKKAKLWILISLVALILVSIAYGKFVAGNSNLIAMDSVPVHHDAQQK
mgnify:CR=1 FL=1